LGGGLIRVAMEVESEEKGSVVWINTTMIISRGYILVG